MSSRLVFVQFIHSVSIGGQFATLEYWSSEKHDKVIQCIEKAGWIQLTLVNGDKRRVPMTNVSFMSEKMGEDDIPTVRK